MCIDPISKEEVKWLKKLQKVLNECPSSRMSSYTIGDSNIVIFDNSVDLSGDDYNDKDVGVIVDDLGIELYTLNFPFPVHGTAG